MFLQFCVSLGRDVRNERLNLLVDNLALLHLLLHLLGREVDLADHLFCLLAALLSILVLIHN